VYIDCRGGTYCPVRSFNATVCPQGYYCPSNSTAPLLCPKNYYCPQGVDTPISCYMGTYCPAGTNFPIPCPLGYKASQLVNDTHQVLYSLQTACEACAPGYYGDDSQRLECYPGTPGYVFLGATTSATPLNRTTERGYKCPAGSYCPAKSSAPIECPVGSYNNLMGQANSSACVPCAAGKRHGCLTIIDDNKLSPLAFLVTSSLSSI
jgi:hypothetical protein